MSDYESVLGAQNQGGGGAAGYGSGLIGGILDAFIGPVMANQQKGWSSRAARHARTWAEYMSNTQYQRAVKDLNAAGLNPMLAYMSGGASTPSSVVAQTPSGFQSDLSGAAARAVGSAKASSENQLNLALMKSQLEINRQNLRSSAAGADSAETMAQYNRDRYGNLGAKVDLEAVQSAADANSASALERLSNKGVLDKEAQIRDAGASSAQTLKGMRDSKIGQALIILKEVLNSTK